MNTLKREAAIRKLLDTSASEYLRSLVVKDFLNDGGQDADIVRRIESKRKPAKAESPNDKAVSPVQTK